MEGGVLDLTFLYGDEDDVGVPGAKIILLGPLNHSFCFIF